MSKQKLQAELVEIEARIAELVAHLDTLKPGERGEYGWGMTLDRIDQTREEKDKVLRKLNPRPAMTEAQAAQIDRTLAVCESFEDGSYDNE